MHGAKLKETAYTYQNTMHCTARRLLQLGVIYFEL